ncbi:DNA-3-methyladenine glycosylase I [Enterobacter sp. CC120223-11]|uniref:DNA-3-methyladenine glycosylase I n=1 Tax=Enterobacter sp. CC120223-11 TaxID=1378073 RepID=UPI000BCC96E0|nr:DNA-3-methyladenine glycosylase I [Enterobacter sp. CC120223-11]SNY66365.1 DNA-3-methyladenine glycosylase I [Enterobacter sp. CC120223-11]
MERCGWVSTDPLYRDYHDNEWGVVQRDSQKLFEMICLEGQQAGLSWITVLKKRENYREAFHHFDPIKVAAMTEDDVEQQVQNAGIIRHRGKIQAIIGNARAFLAMQANGEDFTDFVWSFVDNQPQIRHAASLSEIPTSTPASDALSKALKKRGFKFVGTTICYSFMQACGLVNDHVTSCFCYSGGEDDPQMAK